MAPAHPHATGVAVYPALFEKKVLTRGPLKDVEQREQIVILVSAEIYVDRQIVTGVGAT